MTQQRKAMLLALSAVLLWSTVATAFKLSLQHLTHVELLGLSSIFSTLVLALVLIVQGKFAQVFQSSRREYALSLWLGFLNPFLYYLVLFKAYDLLPAQQAQPINYTWSIMLAVLSVPLLGHKINKQQWVGLVFGYLGVLVISTKGNPFDVELTSPAGIGLALFSTVIWALYWISNTRDQRDPVVMLFTNFLFGLPFIAAYYLAFEPMRMVPIDGILGSAYIGFFEMGICFVLWLMAMKLTDNTARIGSLIFLSPFISLVLIHFVLGEHIHISTLGGLVMIVFGLLFQSWTISITASGIHIRPREQA